METPAPVAASTPAAAPVAIETDGSIKASPLARKLAADKGVDLSMVKGSGDHGRIVKRDIDSFNPAIHTSPQPGVASAQSVPAGVESFTDTPVSQMRKVIASRLSESKNTAPHFYVTMDIDMATSFATKYGRYRRPISSNSATKVSGRHSRTIQSSSKLS